jgi:hypothetical protein
MATQNKNLIVLNEGQLQRAAATDTIQLYDLKVDADITLGGDLTVGGDIISKGQQNIVVQDPILDLGMGNSTTTATAGGFTVSMNRASAFTAEDVTAFVAGVSATSAPTFTVSGGSTAFAAGDVVSITGADDGENDGLYVVASVAAGVVTIKGTGGTAPSGSVPFAQTQFKSASGQTAKAYKVDLSVAIFATGTSAFKDPDGGSWPKGTFVTAYEANATESAFEANGSYDTAAQTSLQEAYEVGNTITTSAAEGDVTIAGDQKLIVSASGGLQVTGGALDVNTSADFDLTGAFTVDGAQAVQVGASSAVSTFTVDASGAISLDAGAASNLTTTVGALTLAGAEGVTVTSTGGTLALNGAGQTVDLNATTLDVDGGAMSFDGSAFNLGAAAALPVDINATTFDMDASGAMNLTGGAASTIVTKAGDLKLDAEAASLILDGGEAAADAVKIVASNAAGGIDIDAGSAGIDVLTTGGISLDAAAASNFTVAGFDLTLATTTSGAVLVSAAGEVDLTSTGLMDLNAGANLDIDVAGTFDMLSSGAFSIDGTGASNVSATSGDLTISTLASGHLVLAAASNIDMDGALIEIDATGALSLAAAQASDFTVAANLTVETTGAGILDLKSAVEVQVSTALLDVNASGAVEVDAAGAISLDSTALASNFSLTANDAGPATLTIAAANAGAGAANLDIDVKSAVTIDSASISLDATKASNLTVTGSGESLTLAAAGGGEQKVEISSAGTGFDAVKVNASAGGIDIDASTAITVDAGGALSLQGGDSTDLTMVANAAGNKLLVIDAQNTGAGKATLKLDADDAIVLGDSASPPTTIQANAFMAFSKSGGLEVTAGEALAAGDAVYVKYDTDGPRYFKAANNAASDDARNVMGLVAASASAGGKFQLQCLAGVSAISAMSGLASSDIGKPVYLGTGGALTLVPPNVSGTTVFRVGFIQNHDLSGVVIAHFMPQFIAKVL